MEKIDILGPSINLTINENETFKTVFGSLLSIWLVMISFAAFLGFGSDIFFRLKPKVTFNRVVNDDIPHFKITDKNFLFAFYDQYSDLPIPDMERRFIPSFDYFNVTLDDINIKKGIPVEKCSGETLDHWKGYYAAVGPSNYLCFPKNITWEISGVMIQGTYNLIRLQLTYCKNNSDPTNGPIIKNCIPKEETVKFLLGKRIQMHYIIETSLVDSFNYTQPQTITAYTGYANTDSLSWTRLTILYKTILTDTDEGFFTESKMTKKFSAIDSIQSEAIYSPDTNAVFSHLIGNSRYKESITRLYIKIQDIFAMMGGFINAAFIILKYLVKYFKTHDMVNQFNNLFKFRYYNEIPNQYNDITKKRNTEYKTNISEIYISSFFNRSIVKNFINNKRLIKENKGKISLEESQEPDMNKILEFFKTKTEYIRKRQLSFNYNTCKRFFTCFKMYDKNLAFQIEINKKVRKKMIKVLSFENIIKLTSYLKFIRDIQLKDYQIEIFKNCMYSNKKRANINWENIGQVMIEANRDNKFNKVDMKLIEMLQN